VTDQTNTQAVAKRESRQIRTVEDIFASSAFKRQIQAALPKHITADSMWRICLTQLRINPELGKCSPESFMGAMLQAAQLGLRPGTLGEAYLIPRWNAKTRTVECNFQPGYQGIVQLAYRSAEVSDISAYPVFEGDFFDYALGDAAHIDHKPNMEAERTAATMTMAYAVIKLVNGGIIRHVMTRGEIDKVRDRFAPRNKEGKVVGPWVTDYLPMACKTVLLRALKFAPKSTELTKAIEASYEADMTFAGSLGGNEAAEPDPTIAPEQLEALRTLALSREPDGDRCEAMLRSAAEQLGFVGELADLPVAVFEHLMESLERMPEVFENEAEDEAAQTPEPKAEPPRRGRPAKVTGDQLSTLGALSATLQELGMSEANVTADMRKCTQGVEHFSDLKKWQAEKLIERWGRLISERQEQQGRV